MANISYTPTFHHDAWVDNVDRVQADGDNGFNIRFTTIEDDLKDVGQVVQQIDTVLSSLGQVVSAPITIGLNPVMLLYRAGIATWSPMRWSVSPGGVDQGSFAEKDVAVAEVWGALPLSLPNGVTLRNLKVLGEQNGNGTMVTDLIQEMRVPPYTRATLVTVNGLGNQNTAPTPIPNTPIFKGDQFLYYLLSRITGAVTTECKLRSFLITYQP